MAQSVLSLFCSGSFVAPAQSTTVLYLSFHCAGVIGGGVTCLGAPDEYVFSTEGLALVKTASSFYATTGGIDVSDTFSTGIVSHPRPLRGHFSERVHLS